MNQTAQNIIDESNEYDNSWSSEDFKNWLYPNNIPGEEREASAEKPSLKHSSPSFDSPGLPDGLGFKFTYDQDKNKLFEELDIPSY